MNTNTNANTNTPDEAALFLDAQINANHEAVRLALGNALDNLAAAINVPTGDLFTKPEVHNRATRAWLAVSGLVRALCIDL